MKLAGLISVEKHMREQTGSSWIDSSIGNIIFRRQGCTLHLHVF